MLPRAYLPVGEIDTEEEWDPRYMVNVLCSFVPCRLWDEAIKRLFYLFDSPSLVDVWTHGRAAMNFDAILPLSVNRREPTYNGPMPVSELKS